MLPPEKSTTEDQPPFYLGLCMAGAISAGAYTAGVVDYLIEALDRWEQARKTGDPRVPGHQVLIDSLTGASAGGMTAAITAASLHDHLDPVNAGMGGFQNFKGRNKLYQAWVDLIQDEMLPLMLKTDNLAEFGAASVLNSNFIDVIAQKMLEVKEVFPPRPYVSKDLEICVSLSNLTGFQEVIEFDNDTEIDHRRASTDEHEVEGRYISTTHRDYGHFLVGNHYHNDGRIPVLFATESNPGLETLRDCAMATGAFPVGLRWRSVRRLGKYLNDNPLINYLAVPSKPKDENQADETPPRHHRQPIQGIKDSQIYASVNVDGGMLNNEPFEIARKIMVRRMEQKPHIMPGALRELESFVKPVPKNAQFSILMVEPFPTVENAPRIQPKQRIILKTIIGQLYATMRSQLLFKQQDLQPAVDKDQLSQFILAPTRDTETQKIIGSMAIACGSLGGFGGFLTKAYRAHDFQLGRRNCQRFIQQYFRVPVDTENPIFHEGYSSDVVRRAFVFTDPKDHKQYLPVIPDIDPDLLGFGPNHLPRTVDKLCPPEEKEPTYPTMPEADLRGFVTRNREALKSRLFSILDANGLFSNLYVGLGARLFKRPVMTAVAKQVEEMVIEDLFDHKLVKKPDF